MPATEAEYLEMAKRIVTLVTEMTANDTPDDARLEKLLQAHELIRNLRYKELLNLAYEYLRDHGPNLNYQPDSFEQLNLQSYIETLHEAVDTLLARNEQMAKKFEEAQLKPKELVAEIEALERQLETAQTPEDLLEIESHLLEKLATLKEHRDKNPIAVQDVLGGKDLSDFRTELIEKTLTKKAALNREQRKLKVSRQKIQEIIDKSNTLTAENLEDLSEEEREITELIEVLSISASAEESLCQYINEQTGLVV